MATANGVKTEDDMHIKSDPEDASPLGLRGGIGFADDDEYEDTGELTMPREGQEIWLAKVPKWVWDALSKPNEKEEPSQIGRIDFFPPDMRLPPSERQDYGKLVLNNTWTNASGIPKEYEVAFTKSNPGNMHIFSEKDLPGYKPYNAYAGRGLQRNANDYTQQSSDTKGDFKVTKRPRYRKAIPKHTALVRTLRKEINCTPVENKEYRDFMERRKKLGEKSGIVMENGGDYVNPNAEMNFGTLFKGNTKPNRGQENKAARIPEAELVTLLYKCFEEFKYWSLKALRQRLKQPEQYLKGVLSTIAVLVTSGPFNGNWTLKTEGNIDWARIDEADQVAPDAGVASEADDQGDDDDDDEEMEDVPV